jgi:DNA-binding NtrC family response regulator
LEAVQRGKFREDLYYRLNTVPITVPPLRERGADIDLLFRKFSTDFAERYHIEPIMLTAEAREMLIKYPFPGNIRQLKNMAEQIQILEGENPAPINPQRLAKYLPSTPTSSRALAFVGGESAESYNERELLYKILFDMRRDVTDLKRLVMKVLNNEAQGSDILKQHSHLFSNIDTDTAFTETKLLPPHAQPNQEISNFVEIDDYETEEIEDIAHETADEESLSLEHKEKEMIIKALQKNNGKRKNAAQALGISERTLYRKIKQYDIEED